MGGVDECRVSGLGLVVPFAGRGFPACVLRGGDEFKALGFEFLINDLPAWQIEAAPSPGGPTEKEDFATAEVGEADGLALAVGNGEVRGDAGLEKACAEDGHFAEAPEVALVDEGLTNFAGEAGEVEPASPLQLLGQRDADVGAAGPLRFDFEAVDAWKGRVGDPEVAVFETAGGQRGLAIFVKDVDGCRRRGAKGCGGPEHSSAVDHNPIVSLGTSTSRAPTAGQPLLRDPERRRGAVSRRILLVRGDVAEVSVEI